MGLLKKGALIGGGLYLAKKFTESKRETREGQQQQQMAQQTNPQMTYRDAGYYDTSNRYPDDKAGWQAPPYHERGPQNYYSNPQWQGSGSGK